MSVLNVTINKVDSKHIFGLTHLAAKSIHCIEVIKDHYKIDAKSLLGLLSLGLRVGDVITFKSDDEVILGEIREYLEV